MRPFSHTAGLQDYVACRDCDLLHQREAADAGQEAVCARCGTVLYRRKSNSVERTLALALSGLILYLPANIYPVMTFEMLDRAQSSTLIDGVFRLNENGLWWVALLVFLCGIALPLVRLLGIFSSMLPLYLGHRPAWLPKFFRHVVMFSEWSMLEVYMLGIVIAIIKLSDMADVTVGIGIYAFIAMLMSSLLVTTSMDADAIWQQMEGNDA